MLTRLLTILMLVCGIYHVNAIAADNMSSKAEKSMQQIVKVNVNTASVEELNLNLYGVGEATAKAIVRYREKNGKFKGVDDLDKVKNIGRRVLEKNKDIISYE